MTNKDKRSKIIKPIIVCLLLLGILLAYGIYVKYYNADSIEYNGRGYTITSEITDKNEIAIIKRRCPYTHKKFNGYKIYTDKHPESSGEIYVQKFNRKFYNVELKGSP